MLGPGEAVSEASSSHVGSLKHRQSQGTEWRIRDLATCANSS